MPTNVPTKISDASNDQQPDTRYPGQYCPIITMFFASRRTCVDARGLGRNGLWWARQDSNLQPDRYECIGRTGIPGKNVVFHRSRLLLFTFGAGYCLVRDWSVSLGTSAPKSILIEMSLNGRLPASSERAEAGFLHSRNTAQMANALLTRVTELSFEKSHTHGGGGSAAPCRHQLELQVWLVISRAAATTSAFTGSNLCFV
ncbi:hypothetical protein DFP91_3432 [Pseudorhodoplanes sinuspersici]|nr:hypothetical protein DFP91_3432 [Pseudorhodoplanes sinuspersici]